MTSDPLWRALRLAAPVRARLLLAGVAAMVTVGCAVALAGVAAWLLGTAAGQPPVLSLSVAVVAVRALGLGRGLSRYVERLAGHDAALRVLAGTRADVWESLEPLLPNGVPVEGRGDLLERLVGDVDALQDLYLRALAPVAVAVGLGVAAVTATTLLLPAAGEVLAFGLALSAVGIPASVLLMDSRAARRRTPARIQLTKDVVETLEGAADLEACGASLAVLARVVDSGEQMRRADRSSAVAAGAGEGLQLLVNGLLVVAVLLVGLPAVAAGTINGVAMAVLVLVTWASAEVTAGLPDAARAIVAARTAAVRLFEVLDADPCVLDPAAPAPVPAGPLGVQVRRLVVVLPGSEQPALDGIDLDLPAGHRVAVVGPSGAGKSTLIDVLLRLREPTAGHVLLNGIDVRDLGQDEVRRAVSGCRQEPWLFATTLHDNLLLARPSASDAEVRAAAESAGLSEWVTGLPEGWATRTGEAGAMVSGGQAQRLALARALLHDPRVLLLDEPTAGLDAELADRVLTDVLQATTGRTLLLVTHRLRGLDEVDEVIVLDRGRVVQRGPAGQLREVPGLFRDLELAEREADALVLGPSPLPRVPRHQAWWASC